MKNFLTALAVSAAFVLAACDSPEAEQTPQPEAPAEEVQAEEPAPALEPVVETEPTAQ